MARAKKAVAGDIVPAIPAKAGERIHRLCLHRVGAGFEAVRFNAVTGEAWQLDGEKWTKIPENDEVPLGEYEVQLVTNDQDFTALRMERTTGATWLLKNREWVRVAE